MDSGAITKMNGGGIGSTSLRESSSYEKAVVILTSTAKPLHNWGGFAVKYKLDIFNTS